MPPQSTSDLLGVITSLAEQLKRANEVITGLETRVKKQSVEGQAKAEADVTRVSDELGKVLKDKRESDRAVQRLTTQV